MGVRSHPSSVTLSFSARTSTRVEQKWQSSCSLHKFLCTKQNCKTKFGIVLKNPLKKFRWYYERAKFNSRRNVWELKSVPSISIYERQTIAMCREKNAKKKHKNKKKGNIIFYVLIIDHRQSETLSSTKTTNKKSIHTKQSMESVESAWLTTNTVMCVGLDILSVCTIFHVQ